MPVGISSAARNLFLLGSSGADVVTNFFKAIDQSASGDDQFVAKAIKYSEYDENYILGLQAEDSNSKKHALVEKRSTNGFLEWNFEIESLDSSDTILTDIHLDVNGKLIVAGSAGDVPFIARYTNNGVIEWSSTTNSANVRYNGIASDSSGQYYACGNTDESGSAQAFVEKYDANGNPGWGKSAINIGSDIVLHAIDTNNRGEVVAGGYLEDTNAEFKGYFVKLDSTTGEVLWDRTLEITDRDWGVVPVTEINDVMIDGNDFIYIVGSQFAGVSGNSAGFICKYTPEGNMLWQKETPIGAPNSGRWRYNCVEADTATGQIIILGSYFENTSDEYGVLVKYSDSGNRLFTRVLESTEASPPEFGTITTPRGGMALDATPSFYYILFTDQDTNPANTIPDKYTYGKVSSSGNGLGAFSYDTGDANTIEYYIQDIGDRIGRLSDGSVRYDTSDLATNILNPTRIMFDDLATPITNKKRQMNRAGDFEYSGSPAIRPTDFQELNLLGDVYSGSGDWLDQSGKSNDGLLDKTFENFHLSRNDFTIEGWVRVQSTSFFKNIITKWNFDTNREFIVRVGSNFNRITLVLQKESTETNVTFEGSTQIALNTWYHFAIVRNGNNIDIYLNGTKDNGADTFDDSVLISNAPINIATINQGSSFAPVWISNLRVINGVALYTSNFTPSTTPLQSTPETVLLTCQNSLSDSSSYNWNIQNGGSPTVSAIEPNTGFGSIFFDGVDDYSFITKRGPTWNASGYWEFNGDDDYIDLGTQPVDSDLNMSSPSGGGLAVEWWGYYNGTGDSFQRIVDRSNGGGSLNGWAIYTGAVGSATQIRLTTDGESRVLSTGTIFTANIWQHWCITWDQSSGDWAWYLNGKPTSSNGNANWNIPAVETGMRIGSWNHSTGREYNGRIGEVRIYPRALTAAQVFQNYNATKSKYLNEAPDTAPKIGPGIVYDSNLLLNYDFGNRATYDQKAVNLIFNSNTPSLWAGQQNYTITQGFSDPFGGATASKVINNNPSNNALYQPIGATMAYYPVGTTMCASFWIKSVDGSTGTWGVNMFDGTSHNRGTVSITGEWQRVSFTFTTSNSGNIYWSDNRDSLADTNEAYVYGFQLNPSGTPGTYVETTSSIIAPPTTVKNLANMSFNPSINFESTIDGAEFNSDGYFVFDNANNDEIISNEITVTDTGRSGLTVEVWANLSSSTVFGSGGTAWLFGEEGRYRLIYNADVINWVCSTTNNGWYTTGTSITPSVSVLDGWHHIVGVYDGTNIRLDLDGTTLETSTSAISGNVNTGGNPLMSLMGTDASNVGWGTGSIGQVRVYSRGLTNTEILQNFNATRAKYGV